MHSRALRLADLDLSSLPGRTYHCWNYRMQDNVSVSIAIYPCFFISRRDLASCLRTTRRLPEYLHRQGRWASFIYHERSGAFLVCYLARLFRQDCSFFPLEPADNRFHATGAQRIPTIPSLVLLAPPVSSPFLDSNEEIDLQATGSLSC